MPILKKPDAYKSINSSSVIIIKQEHTKQENIKQEHSNKPQQYPLGFIWIDK